MKSFIRTGVKVLFVTLVITLSGFAADTTHAAAGGLTLSPTSIDTEVAPGNTYTGQMSLLNQSDLTTSYKVYATPYSVSGEEYKPYFSPIKGATDITKWFSIKSTGGTLKVGAQDTIPFTITVPKGTGGGSYYATLFAETNESGTTGVVTRKRVGMIIYLRVSGNVIEKGSVDQWNVPILQEAPLTATIKIANSGSVHFPAKTHVTISDLFGNQKFSYERSPEILPQKLRSTPITWQKGATLGFYKVNGEVSYLNKTEKLPTKFVFVANTSMRLLIIGVLLLLVISVVFIGRKHATAHKK
jgi:hypothetical protein